MRTARRLSCGPLLAGVLCCPACGGGGLATTSTPTGPQTTTFTGNTQLEDNGCSTDSNHEFGAGEGDVTVTLVAAAANPMRVQICHAGAVNHALECTIPPFALIGVGHSLRAPLRGGRTTQRVAIVPEGCGLGNNVGKGPLLSYTVTVSYPR